MTHRIDAAHALARLILDMTILVYCITALLESRTGRRKRKDRENDTKGQEAGCPVKQESEDNIQGR